MKRGRGLGIFFMIMVNACVAQDRDLASISYDVSKLTYNDTAAHAKQLELKLGIPLYQKKKNSVAATVSYKNLSFDKLPGSFGNSFHGLSLQLGWLTRLSDKSSLAVFSQAGLFSDWKDIKSRDIRYGAGFRYRIKHSEKLSTGWGIAYARQFFGNQIIPYIDIDYRPNEKWSFKGQFPVKPKIMYQLNKKAGLGFELSGAASSYRLTESQHKYIQQNQWAGLLKFEYSFAKSWLLHIGAGSNLKQVYKLYNDGSHTAWTIITVPLGKKEEPVRKIESRGLALQIKISYRPFPYL